jgi:pimeloyl-ACP methyl ester carboxylesterase
MSGHPTSAVDAWAALGATHVLAGWPVFVVDAPALDDETADPLLVLHGFPTSSYDFHLVLAALREHRRVVMLDMLGYGLSAKPDMAYTVALQADVVAALTDALSLREVALLTHDVGDTVGGELLARALDGDWTVEVTRRVLTNGSIYIDLAQLSAGQRMLLDLPDTRLEPGGPIDGRAVAAGVAATFGRRSAVDPAELDAVAAYAEEDDGHLLLPRLIRYIEERRRDERRFTGAIERHPSPLAVVWGVDDPIAVAPMVDRLLEARADAHVTRLDGVGHYPMIEDPDRFGAAVVAALA